jgi:hypothetical protein
VWRLASAVICTGCVLLSAMMLVDGVFVSEAGVPEGAVLGLTAGLVGLIALLLLAGNRGRKR